jgi:hypothetical protein
MMSSFKRLAEMNLDKLHAATSTSDAGNQNREFTSASIALSQIIIVINGIDRIQSEMAALEKSRLK